MEKSPDTEFAPLARMLAEATPLFPLTAFAPVMRLEIIAHATSTKVTGSRSLARSGSNEKKDLHPQQCIHNESKCHQLD